MPRFVALIFLAGALLGVAGTIVVPRVVGPYVPSVFGGPEEVEGRVSGKLRESDRLLLTVETERGNVLATFTQRVQEIDLLVSVGDTLVMSMEKYSPFVQDPTLARVASPPGGHPPGPANVPPTAPAELETVPSAASPTPVPEPPGVDSTVMPPADSNAPASEPAPAEPAPVDTPPTS